MHTLLKAPCVSLEPQHITAAHAMAPMHTGLLGLFLHPHQTLMHSSLSSCSGSIAFLLTDCV